MRCKALLALAAVATLAVPAPAYAADQRPPDLPSPTTQGCVGASAVTASDEPWSQQLLAPDEIWPVTRGAGTLVAVVDTGVSASAPALRGAVLAGTDITGGHANSDCFGRGTALAGIVAARPVSGVGFAGMAPASTILPVRIVDPSGKITGARTAAGIRAATAAHARVVLVGTGVASPSPELSAAVRDAIAHDAIVIASVGSSAVYPAAYPEVLAVNAVDSAGTASDTTATAGVDLAAPGVDTISIGPVGQGHYTVEGAPVAAAYVAGTAALIRAYHPGMSGPDVRRRLEETARPATGGSAVGAGTLDAYAAVTALAARHSAIASPPVPPDALAIAEPPATPRSTIVAILTTLGAFVASGLVIGAVLMSRRSTSRGQKMTSGR